MMRISIFLYLSLFLSMLHAQNQIISFNFDGGAYNGTRPQRSINDNGIDGVNVTYDFNHAQLYYRSNSESFYHYFHIQGFSQSQEIGKPSLPVHTDIIFIPQGATFSLQLIDSQYIEYSNFNILPSQAPLSDLNTYASGLFYKDSLAYNSNDFYPSSPVEIIEVFMIQGLRFALVEIHPIQFRASDGSLRLNSRIKYRMNFFNSPSYLNYSEYGTNFLQQLVNIPLNNQYLGTEIENYLNIAKDHSNEVEYLILSHQDFKQATDSLALWKRQLGYKTKVIYNTNWTSNTIQNTISELYHRQQIKPNYLLLLGDHDLLPSKLTDDSTGISYSDIGYVCFDGATDKYPDMSVGRLSARNANEAMNIVLKSIRHEKNPSFDINHYNSASIIANFYSDIDGYEERNYVNLSEEISNILTSNNYNVNSIYSTAANSNPQYWNREGLSDGSPMPIHLQRPQHGWTGNSAKVKESFERTDFLIFIRSKGWSGGISNPYFGQYNGQNLQQNSHPPIVISTAGNTGKFTNPNCFAEFLLQKEDGGAVAVFANISQSYSGYNDGFTMGFMDALWPNSGAIDQFNTIYENGLPPATQYPMQTLGSIKSQASIRMIDYWGSKPKLIHQSIESMHLIGDPSLMIWINTPLQITANIQNSIDCQHDTSLTFVANVDGFATLIIDQEPIANTEISNGIGRFDFNGISGNTATITISKKGYAPYIHTIPLIGHCPKADFRITASSYCVNDSFVIENLSQANNVNYNWSFGNSAFPSHASGQGPFYIRYAQPGSKTVSLSITDSNNISNYIYKEFIVDSICAEQIPGTGNNISRECSGMLCDNGGLGNYSNNTYGSFSIMPSGASQIEVHIQALDMGANDLLNIYDGPDATYPLLIQLTGNTIPIGSIISSTNSITIEQITDAQDISAGFLLNWQCINTQNIPQALFDIKDSISCNGNVQFIDRSTGGIDQWLWDFGDGNFSTQQHPQHTYLTNGTYTASLQVSNQIGMASINTPNAILVNRPNAPIGTDNIRCNSGNIEINALSSQGLTHWYLNDAGDRFFNTGNSLFTTIDSSTVFYAASQYYSSPIRIGKSNQVGIGNYQNSSLNNYMTFDVLADIHLLSIDIYANGFGLGSIFLYNEGNELVNTIDIQLIGGKNTIDFNWNIQQGRGYTIKINTNNQLYSSFSDFNFPYEISNQIKLTGSNDSTTYFYFYNWEIRNQECKSPLTEVHALVSDTLKPLALFSTQIIDAKVLFFNQSKFDETQYWNFGDGDFSLQRNVSHTYQHDGTYEVELISSNGCGSRTHTSSITINSTSIVQSTELDGINIYPNPCQDQLNIDISTSKSQNLTIELYNVLGQLMLSRDEVFRSVNKEIIKINTSQINKGVYFLRINSKSGILVKRIIIE